MIGVSHDDQRLVTYGLDLQIGGLEGVGQQKGHIGDALPRQTKELIAVGISVKINCESCMQWHIEHAAKEGATKRQVLEAVEVGMEMGGGPATVSARFALTVMESVFDA
ncbi:MAG: alkylhydroperoxidase [Rhodospirillaceae bacterium]|nr:alkylhydroperoxidase [Rhodospirillaceae bacterium]